MKENIEEDLKIVEKLIKTMEQDRITFKDEQSKEIYAYFINALANILSDYKRLQEEFKQVDHECERLEQKELRLEKEIEEWQRAYQEEKDKQFELVRENQLAKQALKEQCDIADERNQLLIENQKLQKENKELKKELDRVTYGRNQLFEYATVQQVNSEMLHKVLRVEYIPKQKIKDKIEELNNYYKKEIYPERFHWEDVTITEYYDGMIEILQDLLEEKGE